MNSATIAIDVAKSVLSGHLRAAWSSAGPQAAITRAVPAVPGRASRGDHPHGGVRLSTLLARHAQAHGHQAVLVPPHVVRPYVLRNKTDRTDAKGLLEAFRNEDVHPVPVKSETQQALTALHRLRSTWLATRTARINTLRGLLREFGLLIPVGAHHVIPKVRTLLEDADSGIPGLLRPALAAAVQEIPELDARIRAVEQQLEAAAAQALSVRLPAAAAAIAIGA